MLAGHDSAGQEVGQIEAFDVIRSPMVHGGPKGQVEVAIVQGPIPTYAELMATHQSVDGLGVERSSEQSQVLLLLSLSAQDGPEPPDGHIRNGQEIGERDAEPFI